MTSSRSSKPASIHPRVIELMRERIGVEVCEKMTDREIIEVTEGSFLRLGCSTQHAGEEIAKAFAIAGRRIREKLNK